MKVENHIGETCYCLTENSYVLYDIFDVLTMPLEDNGLATLLWRYETFYSQGHGLKTRRLRDAASSLGRLAMSNLLYLVLGVCTNAAGSISR